MNISKHTFCCFGFLCLMMQSQNLTARMVHTEGNEVKDLSNYHEFGNIGPVVNHSSRIFWYDVNGTEEFIYKGASPSLNEFLELAGDIDGSKVEIVLSKEPSGRIPIRIKGSTEASYGKDFTGVEFNWQMKILRGWAPIQTSVRTGVPEEDLPIEIKVFTGSKAIDPEAIRFPAHIEVREAGQATLDRKVSEAYTTLFMVNHAVPIMLEAQKIKSGTMRSEIAPVFQLNKDKSVRKRCVYTHKSCGYIHIDIDFSVSKDNKTSDSDKVLRVSKPYLDWY